MHKRGVRGLPRRILIAMALLAMVGGTVAGWAKADPIGPAYKYSSYYTEAVGDAQYDAVFGAYRMLSSSFEYHGDTRALLMKLMNEPETNIGRVLTYCLDAGTRFQEDVSYTLVGGLGAQGTLLSGNADKQARVRYLLANSMPNKSLQDVQAFYGIADLTAADVVLATQFAVWNVTNDAQLTSVSSLQGGATEARLTALYNAMLTRAASECGQDVYRNAYGSCPSIDVQGASFSMDEASGRMGPFTIGRSAGIAADAPVDVWIEGLAPDASGIAILDASGRQIATGFNASVGPDANGLRMLNAARMMASDVFYVSIPANVAAAGVTVRAKLVNLVTGTTEAVFTSGTHQPTGTICPVQIRPSAVATLRFGVNAAPTRTPAPVQQGEYEEMVKTGETFPVATLALGLGLVIVSACLIGGKRKRER